MVVDPISMVVSAVISGIISGAASSLTERGIDTHDKKYSELIEAILSHDKEGKMAKALRDLNSEPDYQPYIKILEDRIKTLEAHKDRAVMQAARDFLIEIHGDVFIIQEVIGDKNINIAPFASATINQENIRDKQLDLFTNWDNITRFRKSDLSKQPLSNLDRRNADLIGANLRDADLRNTNLGGANLSGADLSGANLSGVNLLDTRIDHTTKMDEKWKLVWEIASKNL